MTVNDIISYLENINNTTNTIKIHVLSKNNKAILVEVKVKYGKNKHYTYHYGILYPSSKKNKFYLYNGKRRVSFNVKSDSIFTFKDKFRTFSKSTPLNFLEKVYINKFDGKSNRFNTLIAEDNIKKFIQSKFPEVKITHVSVEHDFEVIVELYIKHLDTSFELRYDTKEEIDLYLYTKGNVLDSALLFMGLAINRIKKYLDNYKNTVFKKLNGET